ncbi:uncharacterized protein LOC124803176 [Schistocerca piceifrons]|uniref:uncharacterized protein LOC124803176 n=1 Tax=Schistocerca piceifrons TaxID=274613 RepID=UPI001F5EAEB1|nr:uncharacterized protein LOC124803176 [Schistocerca piceifrons]
MCAAAPRPRLRHPPPGGAIVCKATRRSRQPASRGCARASRRCPTYLPGGVTSLQPASVDSYKQLHFGAHNGLAEVARGPPQERLAPLCSVQRRAARSALALFQLAARRPAGALVKRRVSSSPSPGPSDRHVPPSQSPTDGTDVPPDNLAAEQAPAPDAEETSTSSQHLFDNFIVPTDAFEPGRRSSLPSSDTEEHVRKQRSPRRRKRRRRSPTGSQSVATRDDEDDTQAADISTQRSADNFHDEQDVSQDGTTMEVATHNVTIGAPVETPVSPPTTPDLSHHDAIPMDIGQTHGTGAWADDIEEGTPPPPDELPPPDETTC